MIFNIDDTTILVFDFSSAFDKLTHANFAEGKTTASLFFLKGLKPGPKVNQPFVRENRQVISLSGKVKAHQFANGNSINGNRSAPRGGVKVQEQSGLGR